MASAPIILVPGFWLGAWAFDEVADKLRADGHEVTALTLPGMESKDTDRSGDHVPGPRRRDQGRPRGGRPTGGPGGPQRDRVQRLRRERPVPEKIAAMVYIDTAPGKPPLDPASPMSRSRWSGRRSRPRRTWTA